MGFRPRLRASLVAGERGKIESDEVVELMSIEDSSIMLSTCFRGSAKNISADNADYTDTRPSSPSVGLD